MKRNFVCYDKHGLIHSLLQVEKIHSHYKVLLYMAQNSVINLRNAKWCLLKVDNEEDNFLIESSLYIKPFALNVESIYFDEQIFYPRNLYEKEIDEIIMKNKFIEEGNTIKEYTGKKFYNLESYILPYCRPKELKLEL